jgi:hypothetical protein
MENKTIPEVVQMAAIQKENKDEEKSQSSQGDQE